MNEEKTIFTRPWFWLLAAAPVLIILYGMYIEPVHHKQPYNAQKNAAVQLQVEDTPDLTRDGQVERNLVNRSSGYNSTEQAQHLLQMITDIPGKSEYKISYQTDDDVVVVGANFRKNVIVRIHTRFNGFGTAEKWNGYIMERIKFAAEGGTLNDTPRGKIVGSFTRLTP